MGVVPNFLSSLQEAFQESLHITSAYSVPDLTSGTEASIIFKETWEILCFNWTHSQSE